MAVENPDTGAFHKKDRSGLSLHHGGLPLGHAFCESKIAVGIRFDEIRLSASEEAALAVRSLQIRAGGVTR